MDKRFRFSVCLIACLLFIMFAFQVKADDNFLPADRAFALEVKTLEADKALVSIKIAPEYMLYEEHLQVQMFKDHESLWSRDQLPKAKTKDDEVLGKYEVYTDLLEFKVPLGKGEGRGFFIQYQGCASAGFCYPPIRKQVSFSKTGAITITSVAATALTIKNSTTKNSDTTSSASSTKKNGTNPKEQIQSSSNLHTNHDSSSKQDGNTKAVNATQKAVNAAQEESELQQVTNLFHNKSLPLILLAFLGLGIMLSFTPCVLPMLPILANILVGQNAPLSKKRTLYLASLYVLSVSLCYALAGVAAGLLGSHLQTSLQQPIFLIGLSFLMLLFALSQFNLIHVQFPAFLSGTLHKLEQKQKQGSAIGAVLMGAISALMVSPCVTPALVGALTFIGQTGSAWLGGAALFALAFGMGLPLLVVAGVGSHLLPKAGPWMKYIKHATGALLLVLAVSILMRALPTVSSEATASTHSTFTSVYNTTDLSQALENAKALNKPVILDVYADWCVSCRQMDKEVFENQDVLQRLSEVRLLRLDLTQHSAGSEQLQKELGIIGPPMVLFFGPDGKEIKAYRMAGKSETNHFMDRLKDFLEQASNVHLNGGK